MVLEVFTSLGMLVIKVPMGAGFIVVSRADASQVEKPTTLSC
jgi:hypothetical protein